MKITWLKRRYIGIYLCIVYLNCLKMRNAVTAISSRSCFSTFSLQELDTFFISSCYYFQPTWTYFYYLVSVPFFLTCHQIVIQGARRKDTHTHKAEGKRIWMNDRIWISFFFLCLLLQLVQRTHQKKNNNLCAFDCEVSALFRPFSYSSLSPFVFWQRET